MYGNWSRFKLMTFNSRWALGMLRIPTISPRRFTLPISYTKLVYLLPSSQTSNSTLGFTLLLTFLPISLNFYLSSAPPLHLCPHPPVISMNCPYVYLTSSLHCVLIHFPSPAQGHSTGNAPSLSCTIHLSTPIKSFVLSYKYALISPIVKK